VAALLLLARCGGEIGEPRFGICSTVKCDNTNPYVQCDPADALCKCGPVELDLICGPDEVCTPQGSDAFACINTRCELRQCKPGETCNPSSGKCACGTGPDARECDPSQTCQNGRCSPGLCDGVACKLGSTCDADDGACKCAGVKCDEGVVCLDGACRPEVEACDPTQVPKAFVPECQPGEACFEGACRCAGGTPCSDDQRCSNGACVSDPCSGVNCPSGTTCNPDDSLCHCGTDVEARGPVCAAGQACFQGECVSSSVCEKVTCAPGMVCDPNPEPGQGGFCRCGGIGAAFPRCSQDQTCDLTRTFPGCEGGEPCRDKDCGKLVPGSACDPEDGVCKCGGLDGVVCGGDGQSGYACTVEDAASVCTTLCDPLGDDCTGEHACYYDFASQLALCQARGRALPDRSCKVSSDCVPGSYCALLEGGEERACRELCDLGEVESGNSGCPPAKQCGRLQGSPQANLGQCLSVK
jgi:hypothetical protein